MTDLYKTIGAKIRDLRLNYGAKGLSQEELAREMNTTANTISRWETAAYKPSIDDVYKLARFFKVSIAQFFPELQASRLQALLSATGDLNDDEIDELAEYARFRKARRALAGARTRKRRE